MIGGEPEAMGDYKPLSGVRAVELATYVAGPTVGRMLTHFGADVIKVEDVTAGDYWRMMGAFYNMPDDELENPLFDQYNSGKRDICLNLKSPDGLEALLKLLERADVFIVNVREQSLQRLGLDYGSLKERFPRLIYAQITGYGDTGPDKDLPAFDTSAFWAATGFINDISLDVPGGLHQPADTPASVGDCTTGLALYGAVMTALYARERTGKGDRVTASLFGTALWVMGHLTLGTQERYGRVYPRTHATCTPPPFRCRDGNWIVIALLTSWARDFPRFCQVIGRPELDEDPRFHDALSFVRPENAQALADILDGVFLERTAQEWKQLFDHNKLVCSLIGHFKDVFQSRQAIENEFIQAFTTPSGNSCFVTVPSPRSQRMGMHPFRRGPLWGEHSVELLRELGYPEEAVEEMLRRHSTAQHPPLP